MSKKNCRIFLPFGIKSRHLVLITNYSLNILELNYCMSEIKMNFRNSEFAVMVKWSFVEVS